MWQRLLHPIGQTHKGSLYTVGSAIEDVEQHHLPYVAACILRQRLAVALIRALHLRAAYRPHLMQICKIAVAVQIFLESLCTTLSHGGFICVIVSHTHLLRLHPLSLGLYGIPVVLGSLSRRSLAFFSPVLRIFRIFAVGSFGASLPRVIAIRVWLRVGFFLFSFTSHSVTHRPFSKKRL
ncbi:MAG: hypothetical protein IJR13_10205 [Bacteroidales bacterium]|nr:hypothetical protein [Bacteroidales bacterium]